MKKEINPAFSWFQGGALSGFVIGSMLSLGLANDAGWLIWISVILGAIMVVWVLEKEVEERKWVARKLRRKK